MLKKVLIYLSSFIIIFLVLTFFIKGQILNGKLMYQNSLNTQVGGPFEASNSTARYALTKSVVDYKSLSLNKQLAQFASPDVIVYQGKYLSIFTPGVSFLGIPFYFFGKFFGVQQLTTYLFISLISVINVLLIASVIKKLQMNFILGIFCGSIFLFATNALVYSQTFTQHQLSVFIVLLCILLVLSKPTRIRNTIFGFLLGLGLLFDVPNIIFLFPIVVFLLKKHIDVKIDSSKLFFSFKPTFLMIIIGIVPILIFYGWYNHNLTGSFLKIAQSGGKRFVATTQVASLPLTSAVQSSWNPINLPFKPRLELDGFYTLLVSNERAWWYYCPIVLFGFIGIYFLYKKEKAIALVFISIIAINILMYSMFTDPWGGWAFGSRYLIPSVAILSIGIAFVIDAFKKNIFIISIFFLVLLYSIYISALGALTTANIPPKIEALHLSNPIPYTYAYNLSIIHKNVTSSLLYNVFLSQKLSANNYLDVLVFMLFGLFIALYLTMIFNQKNKNSKEIK